MTLRSGSNTRGRSKRRCWRSRSTSGRKSSAGSRTARTRSRSSVACSFGSTNGGFAKGSNARFESALRAIPRAWRSTTSSFSRSSNRFATCTDLPLSSVPRRAPGFVRTFALVSTGIPSRQHFRARSEASPTRSWTCSPSPGSRPGKLGSSGTPSSASSRRARRTAYPSVSTRVAYATASCSPRFADRWARA